MNKNKNFLLLDSKSKKSNSDFNQLSSPRLVPYQKNILQHKLSQKNLRLQNSYTFDHQKNSSSNNLTSSSIVKYKGSPQKKNHLRSMMRLVNLKQFIQTQSISDQQAIEQRSTKYKIITKLIKNIKQNLRQTLRIWKFNSKMKQKKENKWFKKSAIKLAKFTHITLFKSFQRFKIDQQIKQKKEKQIYNILNLKICPSKDFLNMKNTLNFLQNIFINTKIKATFKKFNQFFQQEQVKLKFLKSINNKVNQNLKYVMNILKINLIQCQILQKNKREIMLKNVILKNIQIKSSKIYRCFLNYILIGNYKKLKAIKTIQSNLNKNLNQVFLNYLNFVKQKKQSLRKIRLQKVFIRTNNVISNHLSLLAEYNYEKSFKALKCLQNLNDIHRLFRKRILNTYFKKWKRRQNHWFKKSAEILAKKTKINLQKSFWRFISKNRSQNLNKILQNSLYSFGQYQKQIYTDHSQI